VLIVRTSWVLLAPERQTVLGFTAAGEDGRGNGHNQNSGSLCKSSPDQFFTGQMPFPPSHQQYQSTECSACIPSY